MIFLTHLAANLDNWDPRVVDGIAAKHRVITFDNRGVGASTGTVPDTIEAMAHDAVTFIRALGFDQVDILGFSMGGMIAQVIALEEPAAHPQVDPHRHRSGRRRGHRQGDPDLEPRRRTSGCSASGIRRRSCSSPGPPTASDQPKQFLARLKERTDNRDKAMSLSGYRAQLKAIHRWGRQEPADLSVIAQPVLVANGDHDRMVPTTNTVDLDRRLPNSELVIYPDAGHGGIFQYHREFVATALEFLDR